MSDDEESKGSSHPDSSQNFAHLLKMLEHPRMKQWIKFHKEKFFRDNNFAIDENYLPYSIYEYKYEINPFTGKEEKVIHDPIYVTFSWNKGKRRYATVISFHQDINLFKTELNKFLRI